jgi:hypothetical protein
MNCIQCGWQMNICKLFSSMIPSIKKEINKYHLEVYETSHE